MSETAMASKMGVGWSGDQPTLPHEIEDPSHLLNIWLGELDSLQKGLDSGTLSTKCRDPLRGRSPSTSRDASGTPVRMRRMSTPRIDSPRLDSYRYSLINLEETLEHDLDAILGELCALETHLGAVASSWSSSSSPPDASQTVRKSKVSPPPASPTPPPPPPPPPPALSSMFLTQQAGQAKMGLTSSEQVEKYLKAVSRAEPEYISAEIVRQNKLAGGVNGKRTHSPDTDSAFCDNVSSHSGSEHSSGDKAKAAAHHVSQSGWPDAETRGDSKLKAEKIRLAMEKMKEASVKKIFIKVFGEDGSAKSLLVDERMSVAQVCRTLADKRHQKRDPSWGLVELLPDLHMERAYEDHECLVENLLMWKADSKNTLWFIKRPEVYDLFSRPEMYLLGDASSQCGFAMDQAARDELVQEYFAGGGTAAAALQIEGPLWLKAEGKKTWKKFHFVLRSSGLYYAPKGKKSSRDLVCLATLDVNQVYYGVKWTPKFKSPTRHGFAIKHPRIQAKNPKYIRYLCADNEDELNKWVTGIRLAKYGTQLYRNYRSLIDQMTHDHLDRLSLCSPLPVSLADPFALMPECVAKFGGSPDSALRLSSTELDQSTTSQPPTATSPPPLPPHRPLLPSEGSVSPSPGEGSSGPSSVEQGFSCDAPEGGTIKKKPGKPALLHRDAARRSTLHKEVRFEAVYAVLGEASPASLSPTPSTPPPTPPPQCSSSPPLPQPPPPSPPPPPAPSLPLDSTASRQLADPLSPQPDRPAPVLKPALSRKPGQDRGGPTSAFTSWRGSPDAGGPVATTATYEDTLRKCRSLTWKTSGDENATTAPGSLDRAGGKSRPALPPKPSGLQHEAQRSKVLSRPPLPPGPWSSGRGNGRPVNGGATEALGRFPNRLSSGEYENASLSEEESVTAAANSALMLVPGSGGGALKSHAGPPLPKRAQDTELTWKRS